MNREQGFSVVEVLITTTLTLVILSATMSSLNDAIGMNDKVTLMADLEQNLRTGLNLLARDFISAGWGIPTGGIPIPSGTGATPVNRPSPPGKNYTFGSALTLAAVDPGSSLGPAGNGRATDMVSILYADNLLLINQNPLASIAVNGSSITVDSSTPISGVPNEIQSGDLMAFSNALGNTMQYVTRVSGQTVYFDTGDPMNLNQPGAAQGSITQLKSGSTYPPTTATRIWLITYYLDTATDPKMPRLIRRINNRAGVVVGLVLEDLQLTYDLVDGVTNPTGVENPTAPNSPNQIRKANIFISGRSSSHIRNNDDYLRRTLTTQVSLRSLAFVDRYH